MDAPIQANASRLIDEAVRPHAERGAVPGVVALAATDQGIFYQNAFGRRNSAGGAPMTLDTVFRIASMTKAITATAAMQLVEQGRLGLEQDMGEVVPELANPQVLEGFDENGKPRLRPARGRVTLRHLLTHTSGLGYDIFNADLGRYMQQAGLPSIMAVKNASLRAPLIFDPGAAWEYGIGIDWTGKIVEKISGQSLEDYFQQHIFRPLDMRDSTFALRSDQQARLVSAHSRMPDNSVQPIELPQPEAPEFHMGGGGLFSTGPDYIRFTRMLLNGGTLDGARVLKPETVALMARNHIGEIEVPVLRSDNPQLALPVELFPGMVKKWGLSFVINTEDVPGARRAGSLAWAGVHNTFFWIDPTERVTAVLMTQMLPANDKAVIEMLVNYELAVYRAVRGG